MKNHYRIKTTKDAKEVARTYLKSVELDNAVSFGLPEIDDRYHIWRAPLRAAATDNIFVVLD